MEILCNIVYIYDKIGRGGESFTTIFKIIMQVVGYNKESEE